MAQLKRSDGVMQLPAATKSRSFRTFLLMAQFEAREVGARIAQARNERGLTQEQLAEIASFSKRSLQDYEGGITIPYRQLRELGQLLNKPTEWFLYGDADQVTAEELAELRTDLAEVKGSLARVEALLQERARAERESS
jgi:transcriptional regulator with XRE-family HTH domain